MFLNVNLAQAIVSPGEVPPDNAAGAFQARYMAEDVVWVLVSGSAEWFLDSVFDAVGKHRLPDSHLHRHALGRLAGCPSPASSPGIFSAAAGILPRGACLHWLPATVL